MKVLKRVFRGVLSRLYLYCGCSVDYYRDPYGCRNYRDFNRDLSLLKEQMKESEYPFEVTRLYPCYGDKRSTSGNLSSHYFYQDLHVAQLIFRHNPVKHVDVGSRIDGFVANVASFREIEIIDIRLHNGLIPNVKYRQMDLMNGDAIIESYTDSISCLHALEHFGLGRYGDPICCDGFKIGFDHIGKMLRSGGRFYFSVPMGPSRIEFHAHRVFSTLFLVELVTKDYEIASFSYIDDNNQFFVDQELTQEGLSTNFGCYYGCAIFELIKK